MELYQSQVQSSVNAIAPLITCFGAVFQLNAGADAIRAAPFIWLSVIALVLLTDKPAEWRIMRMIKESDGFGAHIMVNILCFVCLTSIFLTVIGTWIGAAKSAWSHSACFSINGSGILRVPLVWRLASPVL